VYLCLVYVYLSMSDAYVFVVYDSAGLFVLIRLTYVPSRPMMCICAGCMCICV